eukprot:PLAT10560.2.p1 GENE.PLAT10560.2~~PLAT10560.2.p1  ORF type:complete len:118 (+),score=52.10 PLAT10560.2:52-405(+)
MASSHTTPSADVHGGHKAAMQSMRMRGIKTTALEKELLASFHADCRKQCAVPIEAFVECTRDAGMFAMIYKCRALSKEMNACLGELSGDDKFEEWKAARIGTLPTEATATLPPQSFP